LEHLGIFVPVEVGFGLGPWYIVCYKGTRGLGTALKSS